MKRTRLQLFIVALALLFCNIAKAEDLKIGLTDDMLSAGSQEAFNTALGIDLTGKSDVNLVFALDEGADDSKLTADQLIFMAGYAKSNYQKVTGFDMKALNTVNTLPGGMFDGADKLQTIILPQLDALSENLFKNCNDLTNLTIGGWSNTTGNTGLEMAEIPSACFQACGNLTNLYFTNVEKVGGWAFSGCTSMTAFPILRFKGLRQRFRKLQELEKHHIPFHHHLYRTRF